MLAGAWQKLDCLLGKTSAYTDLCFTLLLPASRCRLEQFGPFIPFLPGLNNGLNDEQAVDDPLTSLDPLVY